MAFRPPTLNLKADLYTFGQFGIGPPRVSGVDCQIRSVAKRTAEDASVSILSATVLWELLLPAGTDIRGRFENPINNYDTVVINRYGVNYPFVVYDVYDVAAGFTNEYRTALIYKGALWPPPIP